MRTIAPFIHAEQLTSAALYWAPVSSFPMPERFARWYAGFFEHFAHRLTGASVQLELMVHYRHTVEPPLSRVFQKHQRDDCPLPGLGRRPSAKPQTATSEDIAAVRDGATPFRMENYAPDFLVWFTDRDLGGMWRRYIGQGGTLAIGVKTDDATKPPEIPKLRVIEECKELKSLDQRLKQAYALNHPFLKKSIEVFGADLQDGEDNRFQDVQFVLPLLSSSDFFAAPGERVKKWFEVFDLYIAESPSDAGVLIASPKPIDAMIADALESLAAGGIEFPER